MIKRFLTLLLLFFLFKAYTQLSTGGSQKKDILSLPTSANAYALDKVGKLPIDLFRGKANITVPIYTIETAGINFPIALSYNTGGIKLNEVASIVGLGWALNLPNSITQNIIDKDDKYSTFYTKDISIVNQNIRSVEVYDNDIRPIIEEFYAGGYDTKPDIFNYNLPNINGSFVVNNGQGHTIPHADIKIETSANLSSIKITDTEGNKFYLTPKNITAYDNGETGLVSASESLYLLDSIKTRTNKTIAFIYGKSLTYTEKIINERANILLTQKPEGIFDSSPPLAPYERYEGTSSNTEMLLTKIIFPEGEVSFQYSDDNNLKTTGTELYRKDLNSQAGIALRKVLVTNKGGKVIKDISLNYSYFESANTSKTYKDYRLKLLEVRDNLQNNQYSFTYDESSPLPARNTSNDDYWGYINSISNTDTMSNLPQKVYTDYTSDQISIANSRNRDTNPAYSQLGTLNKIEYPTKGGKKLYYEPNKIFISKTDYQWGYNQPIGSVINKYPGDDVFDSNTDIDTLVTISPNVFVGKEDPKLQISFGNSCKNNNDDVGQIHDTSCFGSAVYKGNTYGTNGKPGTFLIPSPTAEPVRVMLNRIGNCRCSYTISLLYGKYNITNTDIPVGGIRIKKIEDVNENNVTNVFNYKYQYFDPISSTIKESGILNLPFQYTSLRKNHLRRYTDQGNETGEAYIEKYLIVNNSSGSYNAYGTSDIVTYSQVTEYNDLGSIINIFTQNKTTNRLYSHVFSDYNNWKSGLLRKSIILNNLNDTLRVQDYQHEIKPLKNPLSGYTTLNPEHIAFAFDLEIMKYKKQLSPSMPVEAELYEVNKEYMAIESGKIESTQSTTKEFFGDKVLESKIINTYYDTVLQDPINIKSTINFLPSGERLEITYNYAHEKNNQLMINENMVSIPLETTTTQTIGTVTKTLSKTETIYPTSVPTLQTGNLVLPLSVKSYDILNNSPSTEASYDKYDEKGNIVQYTTKDGTPVTIVWGYNKTEPIAKIEGMTYDQVSSSLNTTAIIAASDNDASNPSQENTLLDALTEFRKQPALAGKLVTTYTYDPLIGVTSITPPSGVREVFVYDAANRLKEVKIREKDGAGNHVYKKVKEFNYNYK